MSWALSSAGFRVPRKPGRVQRRFSGLGGWELAWEITRLAAGRSREVGREISFCVFGTVFFRSSAFGISVFEFSVFEIFSFSFLDFLSFGFSDFFEFSVFGFFGFSVFEVFNFSVWDFWVFRFVDLGFAAFDLSSKHTYLVLRWFCGGFHRF